MFTRVGLQSSLVAIQQHLRSKAQLRDGSSSLNRSAEHHEVPSTSQASFPMHADANAGNAMSYHPRMQVVSWGVQPTNAFAPRCRTIYNNSADERCDDVMEPSSAAPVATYTIVPRTMLVQLVCTFLQAHMTDTTTLPNAHIRCSHNPHGWDCLQAAATSDERISVRNSTNNYNRPHPTCGDPAHYLYCTTPPSIPMEDYLMRLSEYFRTTDAVFLTACDYFHRVVERHFLASADNHNAPLLVTPWSVHRLYFACCVIAVKWFEDVPYDNAYYASVGGISTYELNKIEQYVLSLLEFNAYADGTTIDRTMRLLHDMTRASLDERPFPIYAQWYRAFMEERRVRVTPTLSATILRSYKDSPRSLSCFSSASSILGTSMGITPRGPLPIDTDEHLFA